MERRKRFSQNGNGRWCKNGSSNKLLSSGFTYPDKRTRESDRRLMATISFTPRVYYGILLLCGEYRYDYLTVSCLITLYVYMPMLPRGSVHEAPRRLLWLGWQYKLRIFKFVGVHNPRTMQCRSTYVRSFLSKRRLKISLRESIGPRVYILCIIYSPSSPFFFFFLSFLSWNLFSLPSLDPQAEARDRDRILVLISKRFRFAGYFLKFAVKIHCHVTECKQF